MGCSGAHNRKEIVRTAFQTNYMYLRLVERLFLIRQYMLLPLLVAVYKKGFAGDKCTTNQRASRPLITEVDEKKRLSIVCSCFSCTLTVAVNCIDSLGALSSKALYLYYKRFFYVNFLLQVSGRGTLTQRFHQTSCKTSIQGEHSC